MTDRPLPPVLHDAHVVIAAPTQAWSGADGDVVAGVHGAFHGDWRYVSRLSLRVGGRPLEVLRREQIDAQTLRWTAMARGIDDHTKDPRVIVVRTRTATAGRIVEDIRVRQSTADVIETTVELAIDVAMAPMHAVRSGTAVESPRPARTAEGVAASDEDRRLVIEAPGAEVALSGATVTLSWPLHLAPGESSVVMSLAMSDRTMVVRAAAPPLADPAPTGDLALDEWVRRALDDISALALAPVDAPGDVFVAAGAPWYLTLFGRDSLLTARMLLPLGPGLAAGTLRALAARQGRAVDAVAAEAPGKILHELRAVDHEVPREGLVFPPVYYGTIDATPLWVCLLHDAWRAGMPEHEVRALVPAMRAALDWIRTHGDSDGDGFLEYIDASGTGLANQGWKDSSDSVRWHDGRVAEGPIALCEAQGYAHEAALAGATILEVLSVAEPGEAERLRSWAGELAQRFRASFWVERDGIRFPAMALDGAKRAVDSLSSNIGHLLGTGIMSPEEERTVAALLMSTPMRSGYGLRTLAADEHGYWPLSYHCGSVWPHDTALSIFGLRRAGFAEEARALAEELRRAAIHFDGRLPELWSGEAPEVGAPVPYPTACFPQAWSAAAVLPAIEALAR